MASRMSVPSTFIRLRIVSLILAGWLGMAVSVMPVDARQGALASTALTRFSGQIAGMAGSPDSPTGFALLVRPGRVIEFRLAPNATTTALSAEAKVAGLQVGNYAIVSARRVRKVWVAVHIDYDVLPIIPGRATVSGLVLRVTPNGKRFQLRTDVGEVHWITIRPNTKFRVDGQLQAGAPTLAKGDEVQVVVLKRGWIALEINLRTGSQFPY